MYVFQVTSADITAYHTKKRSGFGGRKTKGTKKPAGKSFTMHDQRKRFLYSLRTLACQHLEESQTPSSQGQVFIFWHRILLPVFTCPVHAWTSICMCIYIYIYIYYMLRAPAHACSGHGCQAIDAVIAELRTRHPAAFMSLESDADDVKSKEQVYRDQIMDFWRKRRYSLRKAEKKAAAAEIAAAAAAAAAAAEPVPAAANVAPAVVGAAVASASDEGGAAGSAARAPRRSTRSSPSKQKKN
jgi:hypothetical protein